MPGDDFHEELRNPSRIEAQFGGNHLLMQYARDKDLVWLGEIENHVLAMLKSTQTWTNGIALSTDGWGFRQKLNTILEAVPVSDSLG